MQDAHGIGYGDRLGDRWPEYAVAGKQATTVGDLLSHATGLCGVVPPDMSMVRLRDDRAGIVRHLERAEPVHPPGSSHVHRFYDLTFGWLAAALVERVSGTPFPAGVGELAARLGISDECFCGNMPADLVPDTTTSRVASLSNSIMEDLELFGASSSSSPPPPAPPTSSSSVSSSASSCAGTPAAPPTAPARLGRSSSSASLRSVSSNVSLDGGEGRPFSKPHSGAANSLELARCAIESLSASLTSDELGEAGELDDLHALPPYLLELNYFNSPTLRAACVPSATAHFSARALARLYACLANDGEVDGVRVLRRGRVAQMMNLLPHDPADPARTAPAGDRAAYGAGLRLYDVERKSGRVQERAAIGNSGLGGTMGFAIPEHKLAVAVTVNKLNLVSAASALAVHVVCKSLGAPVPTQIANMERRARAVMRRENSNDIFAALKSATASDFAQALAG
jgi:CubicO group peptidase (beta-lactamase class C family)